MTENNFDRGLSEIANNHQITEEYIAKAMKEGMVRLEIGCDEFRQEWFVMNQNYYADNGKPRFPADFEVGVHGTTCEEKDCQKLMHVYQNVLLFSSDINQESIRNFLDDLQKEYFPPELEN